MAWTDANRNYFFDTNEHFKDRYCSNQLLDNGNHEFRTLTRLGALANGLPQAQADILVESARHTALRLSQLLPSAAHTSPGYVMDMPPWLVIGKFAGVGRNIHGVTRVGVFAREGQFFLLFRCTPPLNEISLLNEIYAIANRQEFGQSTQGHWQEHPQDHLLLNIPINPDPNSTFPPGHPLSNGHPVAEFLENINNQLYDSEEQTLLQRDFFFGHMAHVPDEIGVVIWPWLRDQEHLVAPDQDQDQDQDPIPNQNSKMNLNTILYGPPGTGKTHSVTAMALSIIDGEAQDNVHLFSRYSAAVIAGYGTPVVSGDEWRNWNSRFDDLLRSGRVEVTTFHQNYSYEDFIEGLKAETLNASVVYRCEMGTLTRIAYRALYAWITGRPSAGSSLSAEEMPVVSNWLSTRELPLAARQAGSAAPPYVLIIDEINRGNVARIFGELITLVEESKRARLSVEVELGHQPIFATLPYTKSPFILPPNLFILGTMNTADRSLIGLDAALRRRFEFIELAPKPDQLPTIIDQGQSVDLRQLLTRINARIVDIEQSHDHTIGHAYFYGITNMQDLASAMSRKVIPQLREYFFDRPADIAQILSTGDHDLDFVDEIGRTNRASLTNPISYQSLYYDPQ
jgi:hypothetical protein